MMGVGRWRGLLRLHLHLQVLTYLLYFIQQVLDQRNLKRCNKDSEFFIMKPHNQTKSRFLLGGSNVN